MALVPGTTLGPYRVTAKKHGARAVRVGVGGNRPALGPPSYYDILQTPDYVVIFQEMSNNNPRIVPMDGRPHLPHTIRLWPGDSRGHWEDETLVVETTNFTPKAQYHRNFHFRGSSEA